MKNWVLNICVALTMVTMVSLLAAVLTGDTTRETEELQTLETTINTDVAEPKTIRVLTDVGTEEMPLVDYLTGVLLCEIPADFHEEAKRAQAIVARTYALRVADLGLKHGSGVVCADPGCCQGYIGAKDYIHKWGISEPVALAQKAVEDTTGMVLTYGGKLIDATYFSCSGGMTEDALAVWGADVPYLQSVESPGEEESGHYMQTLRFSAEEFAFLLGVKGTGYPANWFGPVTYTEGGGVAEMQVCGEYFSGTYMRQKLGLRSTCFTVTATTDSVVITTLGFGHRVGLSQYGADAMAKAGSSCEDILNHYYQGVTLVTTN